MKEKTTEVSEVKVNKKLWSRKWASEGMEVIHVDNLRIKEGKTLEDFKMRIEKIMWRTFYMPAGDVKGVQYTYIDGMECHWFNDDMNLQRALFHTTELIPFEIAKQGFDVIQTWMDRIKDSHE